MQAGLFDRPLTVRSLVGDPSVAKLPNGMIHSITHVGGNTRYAVPASPYSLLGSCDEPALAAKVFSLPATRVGAPIYVAVLDHCLVTPSGAVVTRDGSLVLESLNSYDAGNFLDGFGHEFALIGGVLALRSAAAPVELAGDVIYNRDVGEYGYFHWMNSILPRFGVAPPLRPGARATYLVAHNTPFARRSLALLGLAPSAIVPLRGQYQFCERLHFLSPWVIGGNHWTRPPEVSDFYACLKSALGIGGTACEDAIYLSRSDASVRRLVNEAAAMHVLARHGCRVAVTSGMDLDAQAALFHRVKLCVGVHGAGLSNLVFMQPGASVIEIVSPDRLWPTYRSLAARMGLSYTAIMGTRVAGATVAEGLAVGNDDFAVSLPGLDYVLSVLR